MPVVVLNYFAAEREAYSGTGVGLLAVKSLENFEYLLGELGVGYLSWIEWNNLDISGVLFAILVVGCVGVILDTGFNKLAGLVTYQE